MTMNGTETRQRWRARCSASQGPLRQCMDRGQDSRNPFFIFQKLFFEASRICFRYGYTPTTIWMDNLYCYGEEERLDVSPISS